MDELTPKQQKECVLIFHCQPSDENGTDLPRVHKHLIPDYDICFTYNMPMRNGHNTTYFLFVFKHLY